MRYFKITASKLVIGEAKPGGTLTIHMRFGKGATDEQVRVSAVAAIKNSGFSISGSPVYVELSKAEYNRSMRSAATRA